MVGVIISLNVDRIYIYSLFFVSFFQNSRNEKIKLVSADSKAEFPDAKVCFSLFSDLTKPYLGHLSHSDDLLVLVGIHHCELLIVLTSS